MPYGTASPDGPKSGCSRLLPALAETSQAAERACTGSRETSACQTLSAGNTGHDVPGSARAPTAVVASTASIGMVVNGRRCTPEVSAFGRAQ
jgi:hypothetical protein